MPNATNSKKPVLFFFVAIFVRDIRFVISKLSVTVLLVVCFSVGHGVLYLVPTFRKCFTIISTTVLVYHL